MVAGFQVRSGLSVTRARFHRRGEGFGVILDLLAPALHRRRDRFVILIDGGSGSGKTTLAVGLQAGLCAVGRPAQLVSLDACYPGWQGLSAASDMVSDDILNPAVSGFRRWDWSQNRPSEWVEIDPDRPVIVEGCGALTARSAAYATLGVWLERDVDERREAALARDGASFVPHWNAWAEQEHEHWCRNRPWELADLVCVVGPR